MIQDQLKQIGIEIKIANVEGSAVFDLFFPESGDFADADYDIALFAWVGTPFTASSNQSLFIPGGGQNEMSYDNEEVGDLFTEAIQTADPEETVTKTNEVDTILWKDLPTIPLYAKPTLLPARETVLNVDRQRKHLRSALERGHVGRRSSSAPATGSAGLNTSEGAGHHLVVGPSRFRHREVRHARFHRPATRHLAVRPLPRLDPRVRRGVHAR